MELLIFIFGASIGSFLNELIDRLPQEKSILGRSKCDFCHKQLKWFDLIPIFSFIFLGRKCRYCHKKLSWQYPIVEAITGVAFISSYTSLDPSTALGMTVVMWGILACLIVIFFSDLKYHLISDYMLVALFIFSTVYLVMVRLAHRDMFVILSLTKDNILSGLIVSIPIFLIYFFSRERAMGLGDVYLSAITGFLLGWKAGFIALYIAFITGAIFGIVMMVLRKKKLKSRIAFGPFIVIGTTTMLFWGERAFDIIKKIYGF